jgi:hypothetical protein
MADVTSLVCYGVLFVIAFYVVMGIIFAAFLTYYVTQTRFADTSSARIYMRIKEMPWRWKIIVSLGVWLYLIVLWLPLILEWNVPPIPPLDGSK